MLPREIFDRRKSKTRDPKRKFVAKEYFLGTNGSTRITDLKTQKVMDLESAIDKFGIIDIQLLDFAGSIFLESKDGSIQSGFNRLFMRNETNNESILSEHKLKLTRFMRSFQHQEAMTELEQILKFGECDEDKFTEFRYTCLKGRILMRWRKFEEAINEFECALQLLEKFSINEKNQLIQERLNRLLPSFDRPNWDDELIDYDEINLNYLYCLTLYWQRHSTTITIILDKLVKYQKIAIDHGFLYDTLSISELRSEIYLQIRDLNTALAVIKQAMVIIEENQLFKLDTLMYIDFSYLYLKLLWYSGHMENLENEYEKIRQKLISLNVKDYIFNILRFELIFYKSKSDIEGSFNIYRSVIERVLVDDTITTITDPYLSSRYIFNYLVLGIYLNEFNGQENIIEIKHMLQKIVNGNPKLEVYPILVNLLQELYTLNPLNINEQEFNKLNVSYQSVLYSSQDKGLRYIIIITHYIHFLILCGKKLDIALQELKSQSIKLANELTSSRFMIVALKVEIIKIGLTVGISQVTNWLCNLNKSVEINDVNILCNNIKHVKNNEEFMQELENMFAQEVYLSNFNDSYINSIKLSLN